MMEAVGVALAVTSLVLDLCNRCKNSSNTFHGLYQDLKCFHHLLVLTQPYLLHLDHIRVACEELATEIKKVLVKHTQGNRLQRMMGAWKDVQPLRTRLAFQVNVLQGCASLLKESDLPPVRSNESSQSLAVVLHDMNELWNKFYPQAQKPNQRLLNEPSQAMLTTIASQSLLPLNASPGTISSLRCSQVMPAGYFQDSSSSLYTTATELSLNCEPPDTSPSQPKVSNIDAEIQDSVVRSLLAASSRPVEELPSHSTQISTLLRSGASFGYRDSKFLRTPLIWAIASGRKDLVDFFLEQQAPVETRDGLWDWTPLIWAVMEDKPDIIGVLISKGADLTATDSISQRNALHWAASFGKHHVVKMLLDRNEELINVTDKKNMTPLALAYFGNHMETARLLVKTGSPASFKSKSHSSVLIWAIIAKDEEFACLMLDHGADAQSTNADDVSVLILAIQQNLPSIAELLVRKGANVQCADGDNTPALTLAVKHQRRDIADMLIRNGALLEAKDGDGNPALLWAIWCNDDEMVKILVENGANLAASGGRGNTLQKSAAWIGNEKIVHLMSGK